MPSRALVLVLASLALLVCACSSYSYEEGGFALRYLPREDALIVLEFQRGLHAEASAAEAAQALDAALQHKRVYPPEGGLIRLDLDREPEPAKPGEEQERADMVELAGCVHVVGARVFDQEGKLCFARVSRIEHFRRVLQIVNAWISREHLRSSEARAEFVPEFPVFDEATRDILRTAAASGHAWFSAEAEAIVLDVPMTAGNAARCLGWIERHSREEGSPHDPNFFDQVTSLEVANGRALLRFGQAPHFVTRIAFCSDEPGKDEAIRQQLKERGLPIGSAAELEKLEELLGTPAPAAPGEARPASPPTK